MIDKEQIDQLNARYVESSPEEVILAFAELYGGKIALSSSLSIEDQVLTHIICSLKKDIRIFTLDTGRLFQETYSLIERTNSRYGIKIELFFPDYVKVQEMVNNFGVNLFYESIEKRKMCCHVRKLEPLHRAFQGLDAWICGLRREQSVTRKNMQLIEYDEINDMVKINPIINWTEEQTWKYIKENNIPYNILHNKGFPSIGCAPCTRAIAEGEDIRAGRWWWEDPDKKECGLHKR